MTTYHATVADANEAALELRRQIDAARILIARLVPDVAAIVRAASDEVEIWWVPAHTGFCGMEIPSEYMVRAVADMAAPAPINIPGAHRCEIVW